MISYHIIMLDLIHNSKCSCVRTCTSITCTYVRTYIINMYVVKSYNYPLIVLFVQCDTSEAIFQALYSFVRIE